MQSQNLNIESLTPKSALTVTTYHLSMSAPCCVISITFSMPKEYYTKTATHVSGRCLFPKSETIIPSPLVHRQRPNLHFKKYLFSQYFITSMYQNLFSHHSICGYSFCFHLVLIINILAVNILHINLYNSCFYFYGLNFQ